MKEGDTMITSPMFKTILVPLDGSAESNAALPAARTIARAFSAPVKLLRVLAPEDRNEASDATHNLQRIADELANSGIHVDAVIRYGDAAEEILNESRSNA